MSRRETTKRREFSHAFEMGVSARRAGKIRKPPTTRGQFKGFETQWLEGWDAEAKRIAEAVVAQRVGPREGVRPLERRDG